MAGGKIPQSFFTMPLVYNGRASSIVPTNYPIKRPLGVIIDRETSRPIFTATKALDYELEMGFFVSNPVEHGQIVKIENAREHIFGFVLLNDWSCRDIQAFEMNPLGPFHSKGKCRPKLFNRPC
jgi:fumarylacetoacetase